MPKFFLIDPSLEQLGVHHYDFARCLAQAASRDGWETHVGAHRRFAANQSEFADATTVAIFRNSTYSKYSHLAGMAAMARLVSAADDSPTHTAATSAPSRSWIAAGHEHYRAWRRATLIREFAVDCERFFAPHIFEEGDEVLLAAASDIELLGLAAYLFNHPRTLQVRWHLLFHFNVFQGRPTSYLSQFSTAQRVRQSFTAALSRIPLHRIHFYATTEELAEQYRRLKVTRFSKLTYPINEQFSCPSPSGPAEHAAGRPLQLTFAGAIRREKKQCEVAQDVVNSLWTDWFATRRVAMRIQRPARTRFVRPKIEVRPPVPTATMDDFVTYFQHPLSEAEYTDLIRTTDIGILAYDSDAYYSRRAGILGEYLSVGRPVTVLGGSWLAERVQDITESYLARYIQQANLADVNWCEPLPANPPTWLQGEHARLEFQRRPLKLTFNKKLPVAALALQFRCVTPEARGSFCRLEFQQFRGSQSLGGVQRMTLGSRERRRTICAVFRMEPHAERFELRFSNAFDNNRICLRDVRLDGIHSEGAAVPRSAVAMIAADVDSIPDAIREIAEHYPHYRATAEEFAQSYRARHRPEVTLRELVQAPTSLVRAAG